MGFIKTATVSSLGAFAFDGSISSNLKKIAFQASKVSTGSAGSADGSSKSLASYYLDGARKLDIRALLETAAPKYDISNNPSDYIFEAIRANSTNVPNENHDAFHRDELLRFDTKLGKPVYMTYEGKPHHMNHLASNPKRARGVILDAHYNDSAGALQSCPICQVATIDPGSRDPSGIHCSSCGATVKDEFVEILVAVDTKKDPTLVRGIQAGILNAGSMGCSARSTVCSVCKHVAHAVSDFCEHIRSAAKGSLWQKKGNKFVRITADDVRAAAKKANFKFSGDKHSLVSSVLIIPELDFEVRKAFEFCQGVEFDEYSRVHRPADPKARTTELLKIAMPHLPNVPVEDMSLEEESNSLIRRAQLEQLIEAKLEASVDRYIAKIAQRLEMHSDSEVIVPDEMAVKIMPGNQQAHEINQVGPDGRSINPQHLQNPADQSLNPEEGQQKSIEDVTQDEMEDDKSQDQDPASWGMMPPGTAESMEYEGSEGSEGPQGSEDHEESQNMEQKYAAVYQDFEVEVFQDKALISSPAGTIFSIKASAPLKTEEDKYKFGRQVMASLLSRGIVRTVMKHKGSFDKRIADAGATEGAMFDFMGGRPDENGGALEGDWSDMKTDERLHFPNIADVGGATDDYEDDFADAREKMPESAIEGRWSDNQDEAEEMSPEDNATEGHDEDMREKRPEYKMDSDALEGSNTDMAGGAGSGSKSKKKASKPGKQSRAAQADEMPKFDPAKADDSADMGGEMAEGDMDSGESDMDSMEVDMDDSESDGEGPSEEEILKTLADCKALISRVQGKKMAPSVGADLSNLLDKAELKVKRRKRFAEKQVEVSKTADAKETEAFSRLKKLYASRLETEKKNFAQKLADTKAIIADQFGRALKIAAKRAALNIETSPLKAKVLDSLTVERPIGRSASTGIPINYQGLDEGLALHLVEAAWAESADEEIESMISRAAEIMQYDEKFLLSAEKDLSKQAAVIPTVTYDVSSQVIDEAQHKSVSIRAELERGNFMFNSEAPEMTDFEQPQNGKAAAISAALKDTKVSRILESLRPAN